MKSGLVTHLRKVIKVVEENLSSDRIFWSIQNLWINLQSPWRGASLTEENAFVWMSVRHEGNTKTSLPLRHHKACCGQQGLLEAEHLLCLQCWHKHQPQTVNQVSNMFLYIYFLRYFNLKVMSVHCENNGKYQKKFNGATNSP